MPPRVPFFNSLNTRRDTDVKKQAKDPVLNIFEGQLKLGAFFSLKYYEDLSFTLEKSGLTCTGIENLCKKYYCNKLIIKAPTGYGKSTAFKKLYIDLNGVEGYSFYYARASIFSSKSRLALDKDIKNALTSKKKVAGLFLIDGFEESFTDDPVGATKALEIISKSKQNIWIACRPEFYERIPSSIRRSFDDVAAITPWTSKEFGNLLSRYEKIDGYQAVAERVRNIAANFQKGNENTVIYCPLYATMMLFIAREERNAPVVPPKYDEYLLLKKFVDLWFLREQNGSDQKEAHLENMRKILLSIYKGVDCTTNDNVIRAFLYIPGSTIIRGFYHKELLVYFIVDAMLHAALLKPETILYWYSQTFYDDITNLLKLAFQHLSNDDCRVIYQNLYSVYRFCYEDPVSAEKKLREIDPRIESVSLLKLKDELLYCIMRLDVDLDDFLTYANHHIDHPMIELGLAYGMANRAQHPLTLQFASKLYPNTKEDIIQRSWALCYYGDCNEDGYTYQDDKKIAWDKVRAVKLARIRRNDPISYRYRLLDIPLLYCFYASRRFKDCTNYRDFETIRDCNIAFENYSPDEAEFLRAKKNLLVEKYKSHLINWYRNHYSKNFSPQNKEESMATNEEMLLQELETQTAVNENLYDFWETKGPAILTKYEDELSVPDGAELTASLDEKLAECKVLILTANFVEGVTVTKCLMHYNDDKPLERIPEDNHLYQFATVRGVKVVHIWPRGTSSFTVHGSFNALTAALKRFTPTFVFAVGVAFGGDSKDENLGDVLVSSHLVFYDSFNKLTDGKLTLSPDEVQAVGDEILNGCRFLDDEEPDGPKRYSMDGKPLGDFGWFKGAMLTGGTVLSDAHEKKLLFGAANAMGRDIIGGEMEGSGVYFACNGADRSIPFVIVKGICDWGVNKNGWNFVAEKQTADKHKQKIIKKKIKDCIQAYACENAFTTTVYMVSQFTKLKKP